LGKSQKPRRTKSAQKEKKKPGECDALKKKKKKKKKSCTKAVEWASALMQIR